MKNHLIFYKEDELLYIIEKNLKELNSNISIILQYEVDKYINRRINDYVNKLELQLVTILKFIKNDENIYHKYYLLQEKQNNPELYKKLIKELINPSRVFKNHKNSYIEELFGD